MEAIKKQLLVNISEIIMQQGLISVDEQRKFLLIISTPMPVEK